MPSSWPFIVLQGLLRHGSPCASAAPSCATPPRPRLVLLIWCVTKVIKTRFSLHRHRTCAAPDHPGPGSSAAGARSWLSAWGPARIAASEAEAPVLGLKPGGVKRMGGGAPATAWWTAPCLPLYAHLALNTVHSVLRARGPPGDLRLLAVLADQAVAARRALAHRA